MKLSAKTIITNIVFKTIEIWKAKLPDQSLDSYDNWKEDIVDSICSKLEKHGIDVSEILIVEEPNIEKQNPEDE
jgi:hypothetical protein